ncbi:hypothetical protein DITRI_Ditri05aG0081100 [Diplodiscus trichospermus]
MARELSMAAVLFVLLAATSLQTTFAVTYTVGDASGWRIPTNNKAFYDDWDDDKDFVVGDILVFNFTTGGHNVAEVREAAYNACTTTNTIFTESNGPESITLNRTGHHYFICTFPDHCSSGQKLDIEVQNGSSSTVPTRPGSSPETPTGVLSPPNSASSVLVATFSFVFMSIHVLLRY